MSGSLYNNNDIDAIFGKEFDKPNTVQVHIKSDAPAVVYCDGEKLCELSTGVPQIFHLPLGRHLFTFSAVERPDVTVEINREFTDSNVREIVAVDDLKAKVNAIRNKERKEEKIRQLRPVFGIVAGILAIAAIAVILATRPRLSILGYDGEVAISPIGGSEIFIVKSNRDYTLELASDWFSISKSKDGIAVTSQRNGTSEERKATVNFSFGNKTKSIDFCQRPLCSKLEVEQATLSIPSLSGRQLISYVTDAPEIQVTSNQSWCEAKVKDGKILISWSENDRGSERFAVIEVRADEKNESITMQQLSAVDSPKPIQIAASQTETSVQNKAKGKVSAKLANVKCNSNSKSDSGLPCLYTSCDLSLKNAEGREIIAVFQYYIEKTPMNKVDDYYSFDGYCADVVTINTSYESHEVRSSMPYYALMYCPNDFKYLYVIVSVYEVVEGGYNCLATAKRVRFRQPEAYFKDAWLEKNYECEGVDYYAFYADFVVIGHKGEEGCCVVVICDSNYQGLNDSALTGGGTLSFAYKNIKYEDCCVILPKADVERALKRNNIKDAFAFVYILDNKGDIIGMSNPIKIHL